MRSPPRRELLTYLTARFDRASERLDHRQDSIVETQSVTVDGISGSDLFGHLPVRKRDHRDAPSAFRIVHRTVEQDELLAVQAAPILGVPSHDGALGVRHVGREGGARRNELKKIIMHACPVPSICAPPTGAAKERTLKLGGAAYSILFREPTPTHQRTIR